MASPSKKIKQTAPCTLLHYYKAPCLDESAGKLLRAKIAQHLPHCRDVEVRSEWCFNVEVEGELSREQEERLVWILKETYEDDAVLSKEKPVLGGADVVEVGPR